MEDPKRIQISTNYYEAELRKAYDSLASIEMFGSTYEILEIVFVPGSPDTYSYLLVEVQ